MAKKYDLRIRIPNALLRAPYHESSEDSSGEVAPPRKPPAKSTTSSSGDLDYMPPVPPDTGIEILDPSPDTMAIIEQEFKPAETAAPQSNEEPAAPAPPPSSSSTTQVEMEDLIRRLLEDAKTKDMASAFTTKFPGAVARTKRDIFFYLSGWNHSWPKTPEFESVLRQVLDKQDEEKKHANQELERLRAQAERQGYQLTPIPPAPTTPKPPLEFARKHRKTDANITEMISRYHIGEYGQPILNGVPAKAKAVVPFLPSTKPKSNTSSSSNTNIKHTPPKSDPNAKKLEHLKKFFNNSNSTAVAAVKRKRIQEEEEDSDDSSDFSSDNDDNSPSYLKPINQHQHHQHQHKKQKK